MTIRTRIAAALFILATGYLAAHLTDALTRAVYPCQWGC